MQDKRVDALYYRLSLADGDLASDDGKRESNSISSQRTCAQEYIKEYMTDVRETVEFIDDGYSGTNFERPGFKRLLFEILQGNIRTIIIKDLSRLGRNYLEVGYYLEKVFPAYRVRVILINDNFDSDILGEVTVGQEIVLKNLINEWYSKDISVKIKSVVDVKKLSGEFVYGTAPFGYKKGKVKNTIEVDLEAAKIVRMIFALANEGKTITQIAQELNKRKIITPSAYLAKIRKNYKVREFWTYESVRNILTNRIYTGDTEAFKSHVVQVGSDRVKSIPWDQRTIIENTHTLIVTREEYFNGRKVVKSKASPSKSQERDILSGYMVCGCCGNRLLKGKATNKNYICVSARYQPGSECSKVKASKETIKDIILRSIKIQLQFVDMQLKKWNRQAQGGSTVRKKAERDLKRINMWLEESQEGSMRLYESFVEGKIDKELFLQKKGLLAENLDRWEQKKKDLEERLKMNSVNQEERQVQEQYVQKYLEVKELDENMMKEFVKRIVVMPDGSVNIEWNYKQIGENGVEGTA